MMKNGVNAFVYSKNHNFNANKDIETAKKNIKGEDCRFREKNEPRPIFVKLTLSLGPENWQ